MPEQFKMVPCPEAEGCVWNETLYHEYVRDSMPKSFDGKEAVVRFLRDERIAPGFTTIMDRRHLLRPEAIESIFILCRITGRHDLPEKAWRMFGAIDTATRTDLANAAISDTTVEKNWMKQDSMESFWMAETLKYFYLMFSEPDLISLDEWVFNTEAHPFRRPKGGRRGWA